MYEIISDDGVLTFILTKTVSRERLIMISKPKWINNSWRYIARGYIPNDCCLNGILYCSKDSAYGSYTWDYQYRWFPHINMPMEYPLPFFIKLSKEISEKNK